MITKIEPRFYIEQARQHNHYATPPLRHNFDVMVTFLRDVAAEQIVW